MQDAVETLVALLGMAAIIALLVALAYSLVDVVFRQPGLSASRRVAWILAILLLNIVGVIAYLRVGPGSQHWMTRDGQPIW